ncbi:hypothetical protein G9P44_002437 [Scheffersomyces stipitis]|nr:hypothetical protein G9P44_002437 [Scheffersomyces stipitis]
MSKRAHPDTDYSSDDGGNTPFYLNSTIPIPPPSAAENTTMESFAKEALPESPNDVKSWAKLISLESATLKETLDNVVVPSLNTLLEKSTHNFRSVQSRISILASNIKGIHNDEESTRRALEKVEKMVQWLVEHPNHGLDYRNYEGNNDGAITTKATENVNFIDLEKRLQIIENTVNMEKRESLSKSSLYPGYTKTGTALAYSEGSPTGTGTNGASIINSHINTIELKEQISLMQMKIQKLEDQLAQFVSRVESQPQPAESASSNVTHISQNDRIS